MFHDLTGGIQQNNKPVGKLENETLGHNTARPRAIMVRIETRKLSERNSDSAKRVNWETCRGRPHDHRFLRCVYCRGLCSSIILFGATDRSGEDLQSH